MSATSAEFRHRLSLPEVAREQQRLAYRSLATALAVNMHLYWTGAAADVHRSGDTSVDWLLREAAAGAVFAAGHGEPGNDLVLAHSNVRAEPAADGGYSFYGRKIFTSLSPVWTWLGLHALDASDPANPKVVHAFVRREAPGYRVVETWDTLGMRPTRSDDTLLEGVRAEPEHVARVLPAGPPDDPFTPGRPRRRIEWLLSIKSIHIVNNPWCSYAWHRDDRAARCVTSAPGD